MALNFPASPVDGQVYFDPTSGNRYVYDATAGTWMSRSNGFFSTVETGQVIFDANDVIGGSNGLYFSTSANTLFANSINVATDMRVRGNLYIGTNTVTITDSAIMAQTFFIMQNGTPLAVPTGSTTNASYEVANSAFAHTNTTLTHSQAVYGAVNSVFGVVNASYTSSNADYVLTNAAYTSVNAGYTVANAAFESANSKVSKSGDTITGTLSIVGDLIVSGNTRQINANTMSISDPLIYLAANNYSSDIVDIGFIANYVNTGGANVHTGLYREHTDKEYYLFQGYDAEPINNHIGALSNNMTLSVLNANIRTSNLNLGGANAITWISSGYGVANAAYGQSNSEVTRLSAAYVVSNAAFAAANNKVATVAGTSGRITSSGSTGITLDLAAAGAGAASYSSGISALTVDAYGRVTAVTGSAGYVVSGGALGTPSSGTLTNCTFPTLNQNTTGNAGTVTNGVYTSGNQTIGGTKTFSTSLRVPTVGTTWIGGFRGDSGITSSTLGTAGSYHGWYSARTPSGGFTIGTLSDTFYCNWATNTNIDNNTNSISTPLYINSAGTAGAAGDFRAPIFYDSNDTGYYADPTSTSNMSIITATRLCAGYNSGDNNSVQCSNWFRSSGDSGWYSQTYGGGVYMTDSTWIRLYGGKQLYSTGYFQSDASMRSPIFYDSNDTGYYTDPNGTSSMATVRASRILLDRNHGHSIFGVYSATRYQGVWSMGESFYLPDDGTTTGNLYGLAWSHPNAGGTAANLNDHGLLVLVNGGFRAAVSGSIRCSTDMRTPIYYDSNDTSYYCDPNSNSSFNTLRCHGNEMYLRGGSPTLRFEDTDQQCATLHNNSNLFYILRHNSYTVGWSTVGSGWWPMTVNLTNNDVSWGGNIAAAYNVSAYASDRRLKENIKEIPNAIEKIKAIRGVTFDWNDKADEVGFKPEKKYNDIGCIAQEVEAILPHVVTLAPFDRWKPGPNEKYSNEYLAEKMDTSRSGENYLTIQYDRMVPLLIQAIKEQQEQIEELKRRL